MPDPDALLLAAADALAAGRMPDAPVAQGKERAVPIRRGGGSNPPGSTN